MPPSFSRLWTPRLQAFEDDQKIFQQEPFHTVFQRHQAVRESTRALDKLIAELHGFLRSAYWVGVSTDWVSYCLGDEIIAPSLYTQIRLFVIILWLRFRHRDNTFGIEEAQRLMLDAQMKWSRSIVPQISFVEDLAQPDEVHGEVSDGSELDSSNSESSDSEDDYIEQDDEAASEESSTEGANDPYDIDEMSEDSDIEDSPVHHWYRAITSFFFPPTIRLEEPRSKKRVVAGLVQMRKLKRTVYNTPHFLREFEHSGLFFQLLEICRPGNLLETSHPDVELSFRFHSWRISYGEMLCRWTPPIRLQPLEITPKQSDHPFDPAKFLLFFSSNPRMHPWRSNPMAAYMFISLSAFKINCRHWLIPCLETLGFAAAGWNLEQVYRDIMRHPVMQTPQASETFLATLDLRLRTVITETALHRKLIKAVNEELFHPLKPSPPASVIPAIPSDTHNRPSMSKLAHNSASSSTASDVRINRRALQVLSDKTPSVRLNSSQRKNAKRREKDKAKKLPSIDVPDESPKTKWNSSCLGCAHKPEQDRCIRVIYVKENPIASRYIGCAITCAPVGDRLKPKCSTKGKKSRIYKRTYIHPADLALKFVEARASDHPVWTDCGRDIVRLIHIHKDGKEYLVGGVRFQALSEKTLKIMQDNHRSVRIRALRRRGDMQAWAYGSMTATGSRMPMGGMEGDGYGPYVCHSGDSVEDIQALFRHAVDTDILITAAKTIYQGIEHDLSELTEESELNRFGRFGAVGFYCSDFMSPVHIDKDTFKTDRPTLHPCIQLSKERCGPDDYNFAMVKWGIAIRTERNTVWVFDGRDEHGTIMPSQSAANQGASSVGKHDTNNTKDVSRASACRDIRHGYNLRCRA
ncbi:hypothetical protein DFH09DRAFT_1220462 [Mycena vulgaris]|nr:hypothetical protein DFH09DRAFT_1220462 [Mycena vulgaris]